MIILFSNTLLLFQETQGFQSYNGPCPDPLCMFATRPLHYHCSRPRCFFATDSDDFLIAHTRDFHDNIDILEGFLFFDRSVDCRIESCTRYLYNKIFINIVLKLFKLLLLSYIIFFFQQ